MDWRRAGTVLLGVGLLLNTGCTFLVAGDRSGRDSWPEEIERLETKRSTEGLTGAEREQLARAYANRSMGHIHHDPAYQRTRLLTAWGSELVRYEKGVGKIGGLPFFLLIPISASLDTLHLPIQGVRTLRVSDNDMRLALEDLERARDLGFDDDVARLGFITGTHLDALGYRLEDYPAPDE